MVTAGYDSAAMAPVKAYLSFAGDETHAAWVKALAKTLRGHDIDATVNEWLIQPGEQIPAAIEHAIRDNDFVVVICTPDYTRLFEQRQGEVGYAADIITGQAVRRHAYDKFIPVLRRGSPDTDIPSLLLPHGYIDLRGGRSGEEYDLLLRALTVTSAHREDDVERLTYWKHLTWTELGERVYRSTGRTRASLRDQLRILPDDLPVPETPIRRLMEAWRNFLRRDTWRRACLLRIDAIIEARKTLAPTVNSDGLVKTLTDLKVRVERPETYISIRGQFTDTLARRLRLDLEQLRRNALRDLRRDTPERDRAESAVNGLRRRTTELLTLGQKDVFPKVLPRDGWRWCREVAFSCRLDGAFRDARGIRHCG